VPQTAEIKLETLQALSFELIGKSVQLWRTYDDSDKGKGQKIEKAARIHEMIIDAMRFHPDIKHLREIAQNLEEVEKELAVAGKIRPIATRSPGTE
jgi:cytochrome oxidase Cu insertion factor (SCO1/SenC/PrrC family)